MSLDGKTFFQVEIPERLHPYSKYKLSVKALPNYSTTKRRPEPDKELDAETSQGVPNVAPSTSISISEPRTNNDSLKFNWNGPEQSKCELFNAKLDGYHYELKGIY